MISYSLSCEEVDWIRLKSALARDRFDNGRIPDQLRRSFENSAVVVIAWAEGEVVGTARALPDGVCNAHVVDAWTHSLYRGRGIATRMMELLLERLPGQHVALFTDDAAGLYGRLRFTEEPGGLTLVVGRWLYREPAGG